jgi:DNA-binding MarR family transcriptional regulator/N-acetylglutamate synthase-like GNAT family acetyltransferase
MESSRASDRYAVHLPKHILDPVNQLSDLDGGCLPDGFGVQEGNVAESDLDASVAAVRRFNRFYTRRIGALGKGHLRSPFSLTEVRVMYEIVHGERPTATGVGRELGLDAGYLSRILRGFEQKGLIERRASEHDARQQLLSMTDLGRETFAALNADASGDIRRMLDALPEAAQRRLVDAMRAIETLLGAPAAAPEPYTLRAHRPGDMGWVVHRHGVLYWREYGWDERFEAIVAGVVAGFIQNFDAARERCWIAEQGGEILGSVFLVRGGGHVAKLRLLLVEPSARGLGLGKRLVDECIRFARETGYRTLSLWTQGELLAARAIYRKAGFRLVHQEPQTHFPAASMAETWEMDL